MSALASDATSVRGAVGDRVGHLLTLLSCVVGSYAIAFKSRCQGAGGWLFRDMLRRLRDGLGGLGRAACHLPRWTSP